MESVHPLHEALEPLAWLKGMWRMENLGHGKYPTVKDFSYYDELSFASVGQPMFNFTAQSFSSDLKKPMHRETGFLRVTPGTNQLTFIVAHMPFGMASIEYGEITDKSINLNGTVISEKEATWPRITQIRREFTLHDNCLEYVFYMATSNTPELTEHLRGKYVKVSEEA